MKRMLPLLFPLIAFTPAALAEDFSPMVLTLSAPPVIQYSFDSSAFSLPVTVSGTPASVTFLLFTRGQAASVSHITNGFLGWHYVNNIDTCLYVSPPF